MATQANRPSHAMLSVHGYKYDLFLLHAGENKDFVRKLYWSLCGINVLPFFDEDSLRLGADADKEMMDALNNSSRFIVPIMSHELKNKPWPEDELKKALQRHTESRRVIIPVFSHITADQCGDSTNEYFKKISRITGIEKKSENGGESESEDDFIKRLVSTFSQEIKRTREDSKETPSTCTTRPDGLDQNVCSDAQSADPTPSVSGGSTSSQYSGDAFDVDEQDAFYPMSEAQKQQMEEEQREHVDIVARHFTQKALKEHISANRKRIENIKRKTEEMRQCRRNEMSQNETHSESSGCSFDTSSNNGSHPQQSHQNFSVQGAHYAVLGHKNTVVVHQHYYHDDSHSTNES